MGALTYYRQEVEQVLSGFVPDLLSIEANWRSHDGLSMDREVTWGVRRMVIGTLNATLGRL